MSSTPTSSPAQTGIKARVGQQPAHPSSARSPTDSGRQSAMFQRELDRLNKPDSRQRNDGEKTDAASAERSARDNVDERESRDGSGDDDGRNPADLPLAAMANALFRAAKVSASQVSAAPELPAEHLARIAAAIQELVTTGASANYQLQLPLGNAVIQGAVLGRDASGNLAIQLIAAGSLSPQQVAQLRSDLIRRMEQKRLKIASVGVSSGNADDKRALQRKPLAKR